MLKAKFGEVTPFLLNIACLYPLQQTSAKILSVSDVYLSDRVFSRP